ncbi:MAG: hypothetical protein ACK47B_00865 [Armatimonadota bacterium]
MASQLILVLIVIFAIYMAYELWRWFRGNPAELTPGQLRRRLAGAVLLAVSLGLAYMEPLTAGEPVRVRLAYLLTSLSFAVVALILALREAAFVMRQYARWRTEMLRSLNTDRQPQETPPPAEEPRR